VQCGVCGGPSAAGRTREGSPPLLRRTLL
jgi:hypothetical protein